MLKIEYTQICGWEPAIRGMRNPLNSWNKSDSFYCDPQFAPYCNGCAYLKSDLCGPYKPHVYRLGENDLDLAMKLSRAGSDHRKFMRMIVVYADITAPLYWWKEYDTYKVGTVANSCSTMHTIHKRDLTLDDFSYEDLDIGSILSIEDIIGSINCNRRLYLETNNKNYWHQIIQLLPSSYNQRRTVLLNYEVLRNIYHARRNHKLTEWHTFCDFIRTLPYSELITGGE